MRINYSPYSILIISILLTGIVIIFFSILFPFPTFNVGNLFSMVIGIIFTLLLINWLELFLIPLLKGIPALIINADGIFINSIGQLIPWADIQKTEIKYTRNNYIIKIFVTNPVIQTNSITKRFWCYFNRLADNTPFTFSTMFIKGRAVDIYNIIKSKQV